MVRMTHNRISILNIEVSILNIEVCILNFVVGVAIIDTCKGLYVQC